MRRLRWELLQTAIYEAAQITSKLIPKSAFHQNGNVGSIRKPQREQHVFRNKSRSLLCKAAQIASATTLGFPSGVSECSLATKTH